MRTADNTDRFEIIDCRSGTAAGEEMKREVYAGLTAAQKHLPCKYFYDSRGSALFERICGLPEYYPTRMELSILKSASRQLMRGMDGGSLIELGSGSNWKIRRLLDAANGCLPRLRYVAVDVCESALLGSAEELLHLYPDLRVSAIVSDYRCALDRIGRDGDRLITFFGGTIGNMDDQEARSFLSSIAAAMGRRDRLLIGADMVKQKDILEAAYNDDQGVTAEFNKNILSVMNRELRAAFDPSCFEHEAFYREDRECIEMHLRANRDLSVEIQDLDLEIEMKQGETIFTEVSRKFRRETLEETAADAGLRITEWFTDRKKWFSVVEFVKKRA